MSEQVTPPPEKPKFFYQLAQENIVKAIKAEQKAHPELGDVAVIFSWRVNTEAPKALLVGDYMELSDIMKIFSGVGDFTKGLALEILNSASKPKENKQ